MCWAPTSPCRCSKRWRWARTRMRLLLEAIQLRRIREPDPLVRAAVIALGRPRARVGPVADELGVSARQLQRRVSEAVGYGPKMLARVLRFRRLQSLPLAPLAELALDAGYADQAHMTTEVTQLAGVHLSDFSETAGPPRRSAWAVPIDQAAAAGNEMARDARLDRLDRRVIA